MGIKRVVLSKMIQKVTPKILLALLFFIFVIVYKDAQQREDACV